MLVGKEYWVGAGYLLKSITGALQDTLPAGQGNNRQFKDWQNGVFDYKNRIDYYGVILECTPVSEPIIGTGWLENP